MANLDIRLADKFRLKRRLGKGSFGMVYLGMGQVEANKSAELADNPLATNLDTGEDIAIKLENVSVYPSHLEQEVSAYELLAGGAGVPRVHWYQPGYCEYNAMAFDLLGPSLEDLFNFCDRKFSLKTVLMLADQLICRFRYIHSRGIIHRDIKAENFLMGTGKYGNRVYVVDMGTSARYRSNFTPIGKNLSLVGTPYFASIRGHLGEELSRRDDMEALGYLMVYFVRGHLPWEEFEEAGDIQEKKKVTSVEELSDGLSKGFKEYFVHVRSLGFEDKPNYAYLRRAFRNSFLREGFEYDNVFDWTILKFLMASEDSNRSSASTDHAVSHAQEKDG